MAKLIADELSARMFVSTFATPISQTDWIAASIIICILQALLRLCLGFTLIFLFFGINVFDLDCSFFATIPFFMITGLVLGFLTSAVVYILGKQCIMQLRAISFTFIALCGVYTPVSALPPALQHISWCLPATYILTGLREHMFNGAALWPFLLKNLALNLVYALIGVLLLSLAIKHAKQQGLANLEGK